ncbi:MAG: XRE family transcriptional regulator [Caldithrix sp.]|nr:MAG: XRE family transcriptional regulator [Caldithrix sp.]
MNFRIPKHPPIQPTSFGQFLKKLRTEKRLSQKELAKLFNVSDESIRNWEKDRFLPKSAFLERIGQFFQIDKKELNFGSGGSQSHFISPPKSNK